MANQMTFIDLGYAGEMRIKTPHGIISMPLNTAQIEDVIENEERLVFENKKRKNKDTGVSL